MSWKAPPKLKEPYTAWKDELQIWQNFTDVEAEKQGSALYLSLPPGSARDAVLELGPNIINGRDAVAKITQKLDTLFLKDDNVATYQAWQSFIKFKRNKSMNMSDYTIEFNKLYNVCKKASLTLPTGVLAIQFLESANLPLEQHRLALATCSKMEYDIMKAQVLKISTDIGTPDTSSILQENEIKVESDTFHVDDSKMYERDNDDYYDDGEDEEHDEPTDALYGSRYFTGYHSQSRSQPMNWQSNRGQPNNRGFPQRGNWRTNRPQAGRQWGASGYNTPKFSSRGGGNTNRSKKINGPDKYGRPRQCRECMSLYHLEDSCPEIEGSITLLTDKATPATKLVRETLGSMVVDVSTLSVERTG